MNGKFLFLVMVVNVESVFSRFKSLNILRRVNVESHTASHLKIESLSTDFNVKVTWLKLNTALLATLVTETAGSVSEGAGCATELVS